MSEAENIKRVVAILNKVPEKHLLLIDLANELTLKNGDLDMNAVLDRQAEVNLAIVEAKAYVNATVRAANALKAFKPRARKK